MRYLLFVSLILLFCFAPAQGQESTVPKAFQFGEIGKTSAKSFNIKVQEYFRVLRSEPSSRGCIINYGTARERTKRTAQITDRVNMRIFGDEPSRLVIVDGGEEKLRTVFWVVPAGAEDPVP